MEQGKFELKPGQLFAGYRVVEKLGPGVMGIVYLARSTVRVRRVALKILKPEFASDSEYVALFEQQAAAAREVEHRNIARLYMAGKERGLLYTACEYIPGETFATLIRRQGRVDVQVALSLLITIGKALRYLHSRGVVHGGVNPGNIRLTPMGEVKLVDVGLAKKLVLRPEESRRQGTVTPVYLAPEVVRRPARVDARADIYSLGITAYEALTGAKPFLADSPQATVLRILNEPLAAEEMKGVPSGIADLIVRMTAKNPQDRPPGMLEVLSEMERATEGLVPAAVGATPAAPVVMRRISRQPLKFIFWVLAAAAVIAVVLAYSLPGGGEPSAQAPDTQPLTLERQGARALDAAKVFEAEHPGDAMGALERYRGIARMFPGTNAAAEAQAAERRLSLALTAKRAEALISEDRLYDAALAFGEFERHYAGTAEGADASRRKAQLLLSVEDRFSNDMLEAARLAQKGDLQRAAGLFDQVEKYGSPEQREEARKRKDETLRRAGVLRLESAHAAAWEAAEPMLAVVTPLIADHRYLKARASCDSFLSSPLPKGVEQIIRWEKKDIDRLLKVEENFAAALGDAQRRGGTSSFTLADGTVISGPVRREQGEYYLYLSEERKWRIRSADLACEGVLKLAGMEVDEVEAVLTRMLYQLYHGQGFGAADPRTLLEGLAARLDEEMLTRYRDKLAVVSALLVRRNWRMRARRDPLDVRRAAEIVDAARALVKQGNLRQAYPLLKQAVQINPDEPGAWSLLAISAAGKGLPLEAIQYYRRALAFNPGSPALWNALGRLYLAQNELGMALAVFGQGARIDPANPAAMRGRVEALTRLELEEEARKVREEWEKARQR